MIRAVVATGRGALLAATAAVACASQPDRPPRGSAHMASDSAHVTVTTDKSAYRAGEPIELRLRLVNRSSLELMLEFSSAQRFDFEIQDARGATRWLWSAEQMFAQVMGQERLPPGGSQEYAERFEGRLLPGTYQVIGRIASGSGLEARTTFVVR